MITHITAAHREVFEALTSGRHDNFALFSCFVGGEPAVAIVVVNPDGAAHTVVPLFVSVSAGMALVDHDGVPPG